MKLDMRGIFKSFGASGVLKNVDFSLEGGEICALLGENGAGKSTLMNILGGVIPADRGEIYIDGAKADFTQPIDSMRAGIAFIHQELNLINDLPVYENMFVGREINGPFGFLDHDKMISETERIFAMMEMELDPRAMVRDLDPSYKQIVETARAIMMNSSVIIMDEPTSSLTETEIERVFAIVRTLASRGVGIVFISHKLREVMRLCTRYVVLRDGSMVASGSVADVTTDSLARFMVGHDVRTETLQRGRQVGRSVLKAENLSDSKFFRGVNFEVKSGEVLGVTGLLGDGRSELFQSIFGAGGGYAGQVYIDGSPVKVKSTTQALNLGLAYQPRNRKENGILKDMDILENGSISIWPVISKFGFIDRARQGELFDRQVKNLRIKMGGRTDLITSLSGGNQQKVMLSRWISSDPRALILDNPTQGVDVGAKEEIYDIILKLADEGVAVIVLSSEAGEIIRVCDRAIVMYHGRIAGIVSGDRMNEHDIMRLATGAESDREV
ncbi:MAG: sugar ABC transporter ATP-binding protein [Synergistaceae bacterium]|jgi:ribose transport system ATP-binding protein|nr:sugar ABC transporter ATP-binding protein [Synergistaceae bacterium]